jgi:DNA-binding MarR family transcriptional regulator
MRSSAAMAEAPRRRRRAGTVRDEARDEAGEEVRDKTHDEATHDEAHVDDVSAGLYRLQRMLSSRRIFSRLAEVSGVALSQQAVTVLRALSAGEPRAVADVARTANMDVGAVSRQLRTLEAAGLATRRTSPNHGSIVLVEATDKGAEVNERIEGVRRRHLVAALSGWQPREREQLGELLLRLVDDLQGTPYRS